MSKSEKGRVSKNTFIKVIEEQRAATPSKYPINLVEFSWEADDRLAYTFSGSQKSTYAALVLLVGLYFVWVGQPMITITAGAVFFLMYVLYTIPPVKVTHFIETEGIRTADTLYLWDDMYNFWIAEKDARMILYINTRLSFPNRLIFIIDTFNDAEKIVNRLIERMPYMVFVKSQGFFEKQADGTYIDATTFIKPVPMNEILRQEALKEGTQNDETTVQKRRSNKASA